MIIVRICVYRVLITQDIDIVVFGINASLMDNLDDSTCLETDEVATRWELRITSFQTYKRRQQ